MTTVELVRVVYPLDARLTVCVCSVCGWPPALATHLCLCGIDHGPPPWRAADAVEAGASS